MVSNCSALHATSISSLLSFLHQSLVGIYTNFCFYMNTISHRNWWWQHVDCLLHCFKSWYRFIGSPRMSRSNLLSRALIVQVCQYPWHNHPWAWYVHSPYLGICVYLYNILGWLSFLSIRPVLRPHPSHHPWGR
jgi:hypothetical protein